MTFGGVEALLKAFYDAYFGSAVRTLTNLPANLQDVVPVTPVIKLTSLGGAVDINDPTFRQPRIDVASFAVDYTSSNLLAYQIEDATLRLLRGQTINGTTVTAVRSGSSPARRPWDDVAVVQFGSSYQLFLSKP
ncbi:MAG: hypothetical protein JWO67_756 [Streptosporangiaceae bacterium]|nr:hypothetical protein [Streptosporangiaceae bacterium]